MCAIMRSCPIIYTYWCGLKMPLICQKLGASGMAEQHFAAIVRLSAKEHSGRMTGSTEYPVTSLKPKESSATCKTTHKKQGCPKSISGCSKIHTTPVVAGLFRPRFNELQHTSQTEAKALGYLARSKAAIPSFKTLRLPHFLILK